MSLGKQTSDSEEEYTTICESSGSFFLSDEQVAKSALIGICGESGAGKTVFLTSIFTCKEEIFPNTATDFDRKTGGAAYFEAQETSIRETGKVNPTVVTTNTWTKIIFEKIEPGLPDKTKKLHVYFWDFAGKHFNALADPTYADKEQGQQEETRRIRKQVDDYLHRCDGIIVLVRSTMFLQEDKTPYKEIQFSSSVKHVISHCRKKKIPVALLFTQGDLNPQLTQQDIADFKYVKSFRTWFTDNLN